MKTKPYNTRKGTLLNYDDGDKRAVYKITGQGNFPGCVRMQDVKTKQNTMIIVKFSKGDYNTFLTPFNESKGWNE